MVNRHQESGKDAGEWLPDRNRCWFAGRVLEVKRAYGLTVDRREATALKQILRGCASMAMELMVCRSASAGGSGRSTGSGDDVLARYDDNRNGRITCKEARRHEIAPFVQHAGQTKHIRFQRQRHYGDKTVTMRRNRGMFAMDFNAIREMPDKEQLSWLATSM